MSWNWGSPPASEVPAEPHVPAPVSASPAPPPPAAPPQSFSTTGVGLDLTSPDPLSVYQPQPGGGFGGGIVGDAVGIISGGLGVPFQLLGGALQGVDKIIGTGVSELLGNRAQTSQAMTLQNFRDSPDSPEKQAAMARMVALPKDASGNVDPYAASQIAFEYLNKTQAYLYPQMQAPVDSTATGIGWNLINQFYAVPQTVERTIAGSAGTFNVLPLVGGFAPQVGPGGNRLGNILMQLSNPATAGSVSETDKWAADQFKAGNWTADQALDFLAGHGAGYSSDPISNLLNELVLDPTIVIPGVSEAAKLAEAGKAPRVGAELASRFAAEGPQTTVNVLHGIQEMANAGDRTATTVLKVGGLIRDTMDPLGAIWGRAPTKILMPDLAPPGVASARTFQEAAGRSTDVADNFAAQWSAIGHEVMDPGLRGQPMYNAGERIGSIYGKPGGAITRMQLDMSTGFSNIARRVLIRTWVAQHVNPKLGRVVEGMLTMAPDDVLGKLIRRPPENFGELFSTEVMGVAKKNLTPVETENLINRAIRSYGMTPEWWTEELKGWSEGSKSLLHLATYGNETGDLVAAVQRIMASGADLSVLRFKPRDLYLMNADTLTKDDAARIVRDLAGIDSPDIAEAAAAKATQDALNAGRTATEAAAEGKAAAAAAQEVARLEAVKVGQDAQRFSKIPKMDLNGSPQEQMDELIKLRYYLENVIAAGAAPSQVSAREAAILRTLDPALGNLHDLGAQGKVPWKLGVAPPEDVPGGRWGMVSDANGEWHSFHDAWAIHVAANATGYLPLAMKVGLVNGKWGVIGSKLSDGVDIMENVINTMSRSISSAMVTQNAKDRMVTLLSSEVGKKLRGGGRGSYGFHADEAQAVANELVRFTNGVSVPARGLMEGERFHALESLIPSRLRGEFTPSDLTAVTMRAFQGDLRVVGLSQYFTGAIKVKVPKLAIFAERVVPFVRFSASPVFQSQMRLEGTFWNILRGNWAAFGPTPTRVDQEVLQMLERAAGTSVQRAGSTAMDASVEMSQQAMHGQELAQIASDKWGSSWWDKISNAKGAEQLNYLRTIQGEISGSLEKAARETGFDLNTVLDYLREVHPTATPDELATHYYYEMITGRPAIPDVVRPGEQVINTAMEASIYGPANMGKKGVVDADGFLARAPMYATDGRKIESMLDLRRAWRDKRITIGEVRQHLSDLNVPEASAQRFEDYLRFDWNVFWGTLREQFNLTPDESFRLQAAIRSMAERHGVTPSDFLSQIVSPIVGKTKEGAARVGTAAKIVTEEGSDATQYVAGLHGLLRSSSERASTVDDLVNQLADVFVPHLNPSAQEVLAEALNTTSEGLAFGVAQEASRRAEQVAAATPVPPVAAPKAAPVPPAAAAAAARVEPRAVSRADPLIKRVLKSAFPDYKGRKITVEPYSGPRHFTLYWDGGTKDDLVLLNVKGESAEVVAEGHPAFNTEAFKKFDQPPGTILAVHSRFQGHDMGIRIFVRNTEDAALGAGAVAPEVRQIGAGVAPVAAAPSSQRQPMLLRGGQSSGFRPRPGNEPAFTITAGGSTGEPIKEVVRILMPDGSVVRPSERALARIQGVPDSVPLPADPVTARVVIGNGVPPPLASAVIGPLTKPGDVGVSLFSGFGMAEMGLPDVTWKGAVEVNPTIADAYRAAHPGTPVTVKDVRNVDFNKMAAETGPVDVLHLSPVCKNLSGAKIQRGEQELDIVTARAGVRAIDAFSPRVVTIENVPGYQGTEAMKLLTNKLTENGYTWDARVYNAADYGVPQSRQRLIVRAVKGDAPDTLPDLPAKQAPVGWYDAVKDLPMVPDKGGLPAWQEKRMRELGHLGKSSPAAVSVPPPSAAQIAAVDAAEAGLPNLAPDAERVMREFSAWTHEAIANGLLKGRTVSPAMSEALDRIGLIPREFAVPYNFTEAQFKFAALDHLAQKENDAMGLMYWRRQRSWAERTINHPMFGLYPASYMWGKVAPNFIKFMAKEQFGLRTAAGLAAVRDAQLALAARYDFDPEFEKAVKSFGASKALWFVGYMLPGAPWDVGAAAPGWAQELLRQADANAQRVANGQQPIPLNLINLLDSETKFTSLQRNLNAPVDAASEIERAAEKMFKDTFGTGTPPLAQPVHATDLTNVLEPQVQQLQQLLLR